MRFNEFLRVFHKTPLIDSAMLAAFGQSRQYRAIQLSRWVQEGKLIQLRRGYYLIAPPFQKEAPSPYLIANTLRRPSYVSLQSALAEFGLIPESVPVVTSVTSGRPGEWITPSGAFRYHHVQKDLFFGYTSTGRTKQTAFMAYPEKAVLDLMYLSRQPITKEWVEEMRFQHVQKFNRKRLLEFAKRFGRDSMNRAAAIFLEYARQWTREFAEAR